MGCIQRGKGREEYSIYILVAGVGVAVINNIVIRHQNKEPVVEVW